MNWKDYLHLYYGQQCVAVKDSVLLKELYYLTSNTLVAWDDSRLVLALRPFRDINLDEASRILKLATDGSIKEASRVDIFTNPERDSVEIYGGQSDKIILEADGVKYFSFGDRDWVAVSVYNSFKITEYLISQGFDVLGLIKSMDVIDKAYLRDVIANLPVFNNDEMAGKAGLVAGQLYKRSGDARVAFFKY